ncbi:hypothetical protein ES332_D05G278800v1 [Gossypium tomentosum]|uniref:Uncharacterized protein n=1 Tax=Gossypium tomentosum TaxID=34277 RepID=A0A5D2L186_GOSTO|nr:hypothetical protein ES332_D05G278800v1 [Gossypium tomentosum]
MTRFSFSAHNRHGLHGSGSLDGFGSGDNFLGGWTPFHNQDVYPPQARDFYPNEAGYGIGFVGGSNGAWFGSVGGPSKFYGRHDMQSDVGHALD